MARIVPGALVLCGVAVSSVQAALVGRGGGMSCDEVLDINWLQDAKQGAGSSYDDGDSPTNGRMTWVNAKAWAESLVYGGFDDWRLPAIVDTGVPGCTFA